jgi:calcineurin-like phosphoesterase family protein
MIYQPKFKHSTEQKVFVYTDIHYRHNPSWPVPIWKMRGFNSAEECDAAQVANWNKKITNNDIVFLLGDTVLGAGKESKEVFCNLIDKALNYKELYIMCGNHYAGYKAVFDTEHERLENSIDKFYRLIVKSFRRNVYLIPNYYEIFVNGQAIVLSHYPTLSWNGMGKGAWMLHGHCHGNLYKTPWIKDNYYKGKAIDIGIETVKEPLDFDEIKAIMDTRVNLLIDHHTGEASSPFC